MSKAKKTPKSKKAKLPADAPLTRHRVDRTYRVFNLTEEDRKVVLELGQKSDGLPRWQVLEALVPVLNGLNLEQESPKPTRAARIDLPDVLLHRLQERSEESGVTMTRLLVLAAKEYADRTPESLHSGKSAPEAEGRKGKKAASV